MLTLSFKRELAAEFEMKDLGRMSRPKGLAETGQDFPSSRKIHYEVSGMMDYKSMELNFKKLSNSVAGSVIGTLMFLMNTCSDVCCAVNTLSQHMVDHKIHWVGAKKLLGYL